MPVVSPLRGSVYQTVSQDGKQQNMETQCVAVITENGRDIRDLSDAVLQQSNFRVFAAPYGTKGVDAVCSGNPTVVTLDLRLPDIDRFEVVRPLGLFSDGGICCSDLARGGTQHPNESGDRCRRLRHQTFPASRTAHPHLMDAAPPVPAKTTPQSRYYGGPCRLRPRTEGVCARRRRAIGPGDRRGVPLPAEVNACKDRRLLYNGLSLEVGTRATEIDGLPIPLMRNEFELLYAVLESRRRVRTTTDLVHQLAVTSMKLADISAKAMMRTRCVWATSAASTGMICAQRGDLKRSVAPAGWLYLAKWSGECERPAHRVAT